MKKFLFAFLVMSQATVFATNRTQVEEFERVDLILQTNSLLCASFIGQSFMGDIDDNIEKSYGIVLGSSIVSEASQDKTRLNKILKEIDLFRTIEPMTCKLLKQYVEAAAMNFSFFIGGKLNVKVKKEILPEDKSCKTTIEGQLKFAPPSGSDLNSGLSFEVKIDVYKCL